MYVQVLMYVCIHVCMYACMFVCTYVHMYDCMYSYFFHAHIPTRLGYANASDVIEMKGRVACEIST